MDFKGQEEMSVKIKWI